MVERCRTILNIDLVRSVGAAQFELTRELGQVHTFMNPRWRDAPLRHFDAPVHMVEFAHGMRIRIDAGATLASCGPVTKAVVSQKPTDGRFARQEADVRPESF